MPDDGLKPNDMMDPWGKEATWCDEHLSPLVVCDGLPHGKSLTELQAEIMDDITDAVKSGVYDKGIFRTTDGSDPLVQEPKGKP